jgi:hypothetical protein
VDYLMSDYGQWCVVVLRDLRCVCSSTGKTEYVPDIVTVSGPFPKWVAVRAADQFNRASTVARVPDDGGPEVYRPVRNAPAFIDQDKWDEHYAQVRPMNDVLW